ncbi:MAG: hypothetical protein H6568_08700 [Lewinellaceae bacterium]|nr:hypothetical protein [Lewinellaceae bacterium]
MYTRIHYWWVLILIVTLLPTSVLDGQTDELTWQPIPLSQVWSVASMKDGFVWAVSSPEYGTGKVTFQKRDWNGAVVWEHPIQIGNHNQARVSDILAYPDGSTLAFINAMQCDYLGPSILIRLDSLGTYVSGTTIPSPRFYSNAIPLKEDEHFPILAWGSGVAIPSLWGNGSSELYRFDSLSAPPVKVPVPDASLNRLMFLDDTGEVRVGLASGGLAVLDPVTGQLSDTTDLSFGPVTVILPQTDTTRWFLRPGKIGLVHQDGSVLQEKVVTDLVPVSGLVRDGHLILLTWDSKTYLRDILVLNEALDILDTDVQFSDDTGIIGLIGDPDHTWVIGQEHQNVFAKDIDPTGSWAPLISDATLVAMNYASTVRDSLDSGLFCHLWNQLTDVQIGVRNDGLDTLRQIILSWSSIMQPSFFTWCDFGWSQLPFDGLAIAPGDTGWMAISQLDLSAQYFCDAPIQDLEFCMEVSCPNGKIDAHHEGDTLCTSFPWISTSLQQDEAPEWNLFLPNPFTDFIQCTTLPAGTVRIRMYGPLGELVAEFSGVETSTSYTIPAGPSGLYLLVGQDQKGRITAWQKLVRSP